MFTTIDEAMDYVKRNQFKMIDLKFTDLAGRWHHISIPASEFNESLMKNGVGFDGSSVGLKSVSSGDMVLIPDLSAAFIDPFWEVPTLSFICSSYEADTKQPFTRDPRNIILRAEKYLQELQIADESRWGPEYEFYIFDNVAFENGINVASYRVDSREADWQSARGGHGHVIPPHGGYHVIPPKDQLFNLRSEMCLTLESMGIEIKYHHHEVGGPGQCEIETPLFGILKAGDSAQMIKYVTKMVAYRHGQTATYMPKPLYGEAGSGMHFHQQLFKESKNVFYDEKGYGHLSQTALWYIGGMLKHGASLLAFTNPSTNSYRRLIPGFEAPVNAFFSLANRSAAIRVPKYATSPEAVRFEFRPPDATCNVYFALAVQLMAGLDGIRNKIDPREHGFGPIDENVFAWPPERREVIKPLPSSLREALEALDRDHAYLLEGGVFDEGHIDDWIKSKYREYYEIRNRPHPYEMFLYYDL